MPALDALQWSLLANAGLMALFALTVIVAKRKIVREKLASFGTGIAAITAGLAQAEKDAEYHLITRSLCGSLSSASADAVNDCLRKAAMIQTHREAGMADMFGETFRSEAVRLNRRYTPQNEMVERVIGWQPTEPAPRDVYGDEGLGLLQIWFERQVIDLYRAGMTPYTTRLLPWG